MEDSGLFTFSFTGSMLETWVLPAIDENNVAFSYKASSYVDSLIKKKIELHM